jgi:hypothetical protein
MRQIILSNTSIDPRIIDPPCIKRGMEIDSTQCQSCGGSKVQIKVFACMQWTKCTIAGPQPEHGQVCRACRSRVA